MQFGVYHFKQKQTIMLTRGIGALNYCQSLCTRGAKSGWVTKCSFARKLSFNSNEHTEKV